MRVSVRAAGNLAASAALACVGLLTAPELLLGLAIAAAVGISIEVLAPLHEGRRSRHAWLVDLTHAVGDRAMIVPVVAVALAVVGPAVPEIGLGAWPLVVQIVVTVVVTDFANYWAHRGLHRVRALWAFHSVHHSSERLDWLATSRVHPLDLAINIGAVTLPTFALGEVEMAPWLLTFFFVWPFVTHANARLRLPGPLGWLLVTPAFHHWHHAADEGAFDKNFGMFLAVWDRLFGTYVDEAEFPVSYGIGSRELETGDYLAHLTAPFRAVRVGVS